MKRGSLWSPARSAHACVKTVLMIKAELSRDLPDALYLASRDRLFKGLNSRMCHRAKEEKQTT